MSIGDVENRTVVAQTVSVKTSKWTWTSVAKNEGKRVRINGWRFQRWCPWFMKSIRFGFNCEHNRRHSTRSCELRLNAFCCVWFNWSTNERDGRVRSNDRLRLLFVYRLRPIRTDSRDKICIANGSVVFLSFSLPILGKLTRTPNTFRLWTIRFVSSSLPTLLRNRFSYYPDLSLGK